MENKYSLHGAFSWCELLTTDTDAAKCFYNTLFNWTLESAPNSLPGEDYTLVKCAGQHIGGMMAIPPGAEGISPNWGIYVTVDDVDATAKLAVEMGGKICMPPQNIPEVGRFCVLQDPQGAVFNVITYLSKTD